MLLTPIEYLMPRHAGKILESAERYNPTMGRMFGVALDEGYEYTTNKMFDIMGKEHSLDERTLPMSKDEWESSPYYREGIEWDEKMSEGRAKLWADEYDTRSIRKSIIESGKAHYGMVGGAVNFFGQLLGNLPDPINLIPVGGGIMRGAGIATRVIKGSRVAALATKAGLPALTGRIAESALASKLAQSQLGRLATGQTGQAIGYGMLEGAAGTALADLIVFPHLQDRGEEIGFADAAIDIAFGADCRTNAQHRPFGAGVLQAQPYGHNNGSDDGVHRSQHDRNNDGGSRRQQRNRERQQHRQHDGQHNGHERMQPPRIKEKNHVRVQQRDLLS